MAFFLAEPPGIIDLPDSLLTAGDGATGYVFSAIKDAAALGSVVPEVFYGTYSDGQTVPLPISPVDGYQYLQSELLYVWEIVNSTNNQFALPSGPGGILWGQWYVDSSTGEVHCGTMYLVEGLASQAQHTSDGQLGVWTFGIRGRGLRTLSSIPSYTDLAATLFAEDDAATQTNLRELSHNTKLSSVQCEIFAVNPSGAALWQPNTVYSAGTLIQPTGSKCNGFWFIAANTGESGPQEPNWPAVWQSTVPVSDGSMIWNIAGAGFYNGQQVLFPPPSPIDGYQYSAEDTITPILAFITTEAIPFQKLTSTTPGNVINLTSGGDNCARIFTKSLSATQPANPTGTSLGGQQPNGLQNTSTLKTALGPTMQNWAAPLAAPSAPSLSSVAGGSLPATTYYVKITFITAPGAETLPSLEASLAVAANNLLVVNAPTLPAGAIAYNVYVATTSGAEQLQGPPVPTSTSTPNNWTEPTTGLVAGAAPPTSNTSGFVPSAAEQSAPAFLSPGSSTTGVGIVNCSVKYGHSTYTDGTVMVWLLCFRKISTMAAPGGANFTDMNTDLFTTGNPLLSSLVQDVNENAKFSILRPEIFSSSVTPGSTVPVPTSPIDGYAYGRGELTYLWYWTSTGSDQDRLRDFSINVDPQSGVVNTRVDYYRDVNGGLATAIYGEGGLSTYNNFTSSGKGQPSVTVVVIARRKHETELQGTVIVGGNGLQPAPPSNYNLIPNGGFEIFSIPNAKTILFGQVADDWGILESSNIYICEQYTPGLVGNFSQGIGNLPSTTSLADRPTSDRHSIISIASMIVPVWPGGQYKFHFDAAAYAAVHSGGDGFSADVIDYGFYARIHILGADSSGEPDTGTDTTFDLLGNLSEQPGIGSSNNPGGGVQVSPPNFTPFDFTFTVPLSGATAAATSAGLSVLSGAIGFTPAFLYVEFVLQDVVSSGTDHFRFVVLDDVILQDLTEGSTNGNQAGGPNGAADYSNYFTYVSTTSSITWSWSAIPYLQPDGTTLTLAAGSFTAFTGLAANTKYFFGAYFDQNPKSSTFGQFVVVLSDVSGGTANESQQQVVQVINGDNHLPLATDMTGSTTSSGGGGGSGGNGASCPAINQVVETRERGFVRADSLRIGEYIRGWDGEWNRIQLLGIEDSDICVVEVAGEKLHVDENHLWLLACTHSDECMQCWVPTWKLTLHTLLRGDDKNVYRPTAIRNLGKGKFVKLTVERNRLKLGRVIGHNYITTKT